MLDSRNTNPVPDHLPEDLFARLERERLDADRRYNDALTEVDRAIRMAPLLPRSATSIRRDARGRSQCGVGHPGA